MVGSAGPFCLQGVRVHIFPMRERVGSRVSGVNQSVLVFFPQIHVPLLLPFPH